MALFVCLVFEDGFRTPSVPVPVTGPGSCLVRMPSGGNGIVRLVEVSDEDGQVINRSPASIVVEDFDWIELTVVPHPHGWPEEATTPAVDEEAVDELVRLLQDMHHRLHQQA